MKTSLSCWQFLKNWHWEVAKTLLNFLVVFESETKTWCEYQADNKGYKDNQVQVVHILFYKIFHDPIVTYWQLL